MSISKDKVEVIPRLLSVAEVAKLLGRSEGWFRANRVRLEGLGFPKSHPLFGKYDRMDIERFVDLSKSGLPVQSKRNRAPSGSDEAILLERAKQWPA